MKVIDLSFNKTPNILTLEQAHKLFKTSYGYTVFLKEKCDVEVVLRLHRDEQEVIDGVKYRSVKAGLFGLSLSTLLGYVKGQHPDVVIVNGLDFAEETVQLRKVLPATSKILVRHHGERYAENKKSAAQRADHSVDGYLFTSFGNAKEWIDNGVIRKQDKCYEVLEASTFMQELEKGEARRILNFPNHVSFLWVGRLNANKDPITVLKGFEKYLSINPDAKLYMIYQQMEPVAEVKAFVNASALLQKAVMLVGWVPNEPLMYWFNSSDYFISGSHKEGSGYALIEAMKCGCIPVVTNIPSFAKMTLNGKFGFLFEKGDVDSLFSLLCGLDHSAIPRLSASVAAHFKSELSYQKIADDVYAICGRLLNR